MDGDFGLNDEYEEGSTDINKGKYTFGDTLTRRLSNGLKSMGPAKLTDENQNHLPAINIGVESKGTYDHPNYTYDFTVTNYTDEKIEGGWELSFDLPKSAVFKSSWGGTITQKDNGDFTTITITSSGWQHLEPGGSATLQGMIGLCFSGVRNITFNGMNPVGKDGDTGTPIPPSNEAPKISGVSNQTIVVGDFFDALAGIKAIDKEDGDLTANVIVKGSVDTTVAGTYELTYEVSDSQGLKTVATRTIIVKDAQEPPVPPSNEAPVILGAKDQTIKVGDSFNPLAGISATDKEDGDLTSNIIVKGAVDTTVAGTYELTYEVTDSQGLVTSVTVTITVKEADIENPDTDTYDSTKIYLTGDQVIYKGQKYTAKWWVQGEAPDQSAAWEKEVTPNEDGSISYEPGMVFTGGEVVKYNNQLYRAKWWTNTTPGTDGSWELIK